MKERNNSSRRVVVIEQEDGVREFCEQLLTSEGYEVSSLPSIKEGFGFLSNAKNASKVELVVLGLDDSDASLRERYIQALKTQVHTRGIQLIAVSAASRAKDLISAYNAGCDYYLPKPFTSAQLSYGVALVLDEEIREAEVKIVLSA